jgi:Transient receptor potential (TRP) ion channel
MIFFSDVFNLPGLVNGILGVVWFLVNALFALVLLILVIISCAYALFSKDPETRYQPMRDDRSSFIRNAKESSTELDALAASVRGDGTEAKELEINDRSREGAQSPEEQYGRFRPMSQHSMRPFTADSNATFNSAPPSTSHDAAFSPPYGRPREQSQGGFRGPAPVRGPRDYEGYSSNYYGPRSESPVPRPPGSRGGAGVDLWKRGVGYE